MTDPIEHEDTDHGVALDAAGETGKPPEGSEPWTSEEGEDAPLTDRPTDVAELAGGASGASGGSAHEGHDATKATETNATSETPETTETLETAQASGDEAAQASDETVHEGETREPTDPPNEAEATAVEMATVDPEMTVNLTGDFDATVNLTGTAGLGSARDDAAVANEVTRGHLKGLLEALVFASDKPIKAGDLAKSATAPAKQVKLLLEELKTEYATRGMQLDEVAGGWIFRTNAAYAPFVRDLTKQRPVKLTRAQIETLAILAYRQPITRPEVDDIRGVDCGPVLKVLLDRDLVRILGKKDEPGRPWLYGTTSQFLEFFGLKSLRDLPTLREFTDLNEESRRTVEKELGETLESVAGEAGALGTPEQEGHEAVGISSDTLPPGMMDEASPMNTEIPPEMPATGEDGEAPPEAHAASTDLEATVGDAPAPKQVAEMDPEEEFPDDDDADFDDDEEDEDEEEEDEEEDEEEKEEEKGE